MLLQARANQVRYRFVVADSWFSSRENMALIKSEEGKDFVMPLRSNRRVVLSLRERRNGCWREVDTVDYPEGTTREA